MKQIIVLVSMIILGCYIAGLINGDDDKTVKSTLTNVWQEEIDRQNTYP